MSTPNDRYVAYSDSIEVEPSNEEQMLMNSPQLSVVSQR